MGTNETTAQEAYNQFWPKATEEIRAMGNAGLKHQELPLARIKKVTFSILGSKYINEFEVTNSTLKNETHETFVTNIDGVETKVSSLVRASR